MNRIHNLGDEEFSLKQYIQRKEIQQEIEEHIQSQQKRYKVNLDKVRNMSESLSESMILDPIWAIRTIKTEIDSIFGGDEKQKKEVDLEIGFDGNLGRNLITPRGLCSNMLGKLCAVQGIVTRISKVCAKVVNTVHYCQTTKVIHSKTYHDDYNLKDHNSINLQQQQNSNLGSRSIPVKDQEGNRLETEFGHCEYRDQQMLVLQEMPEKSPIGQLPRSVEVVLQNDLVDKLKPGDRVQIMGVYKCVDSELIFSQGIFRGVFIAIDVVDIKNIQEQNNLQVEDIKNIKMISQRFQQDHKCELLEVFSNSVAPSIQGNEMIKKGIVLQLLGGNEKRLDNGTRIRGDVNILMIGDPSTAKSQMLRRVMQLSNLAINTTGRGSSGVGLTAAVSYDRYSNERHLEAGAMVLADRGIVCIDEFDKMNEADRVAIHEVMEQQTVTIAKAGIQASLNARCSVLAAANPIYGEYISDLPAQKNINLPDSLLSRFDLCYVVLDIKDTALDRLVAQRVIKNHSYQGINTNVQRVHQDDYVIEPILIHRDDDDSQYQIFQKYDPTIHTQNQTQILQHQFLKNYIQYAKKQCSPTLKDESIEYLSQQWSMMRQTQNKSNNDKSRKSTKYPATNLPVTIRTYESMIRLSSAHAKLRLSRSVEKTDCEIAVHLVYYTVFGRDLQHDDHDHDDDDQPELVQNPSLQLSSLLNRAYEPSDKKPQSSRKKKKDKEEEDIKNLQVFLEQSQISDVTKQQQQLMYRILIRLQANTSGKTKEQVYDEVKTQSIQEITSLQECQRVLQSMVDSDRAVYDESTNLYYLI